MMRRILIKGTSGSGKSTLGRDLAQHLALPFVELDALHWGPRWTAASPDELKQRIASTLDDQRGWVVDGNYDGKIGSLVLDRAELVVWLDLPLLRVLARVTSRTARRWRRDEALWNDNRESFREALWGRDSLFAWTVRAHRRARREWPEVLRDRAHVRLRTPAEIAAWRAQFLRSAESARNLDGR